VRSTAVTRLKCRTSWMSVHAEKLDSAVRCGAAREWRGKAWSVLLQFGRGRYFSI